MEHPGLKSFIVLLIAFLVVVVQYPVNLSSTPLKIGFIGDFTDVSSVYTHNMYRAAVLVVEEMNASGGVLGQTVELIFRDGGNDPQKHYDYVSELAQKEKVVAVFGGASSPPTRQASQAAKKEQIPFLVSIGNSRSIVVEDGHPYVFLFEPNSWMETKGFSIFISIMPWRRYAWVGPDYSWARNILKDFKLRVSEVGTPIEWVLETWHPLGSIQYQTIIQKILNSKAEVLLISTWGQDIENFTIQAQSQGLYDKMAVFGWFTFDVASPAAKVFPVGIWGLTRAPFNYLVTKYPQAKEFVGKFYGRYKEYPNDFTMCLVDSLLAWQQAVKNAGTANPVSVAKTLRGLSFEGMRGQSFIREVDGQMDASVYFGRLEKSEDYPFAVWQSIIALPARNTWLTEKEIFSIRAKAGN